MTTQYTPILKLALPVQGELSGTWGDVVNDNITSMIEQAIAGRSVVNTWAANSHVLTTANGTAAESRAAMLSLTDTGTALTGAGSVVCPALSKTYIVKNGTAQVITVKTASGSGIAVPVGKTMLVYCDGTNVLEGVDHVVTLSAGTLTITGLTTFATLKGADATTVTGILDEDNMASDSATKLVTQQSVKAYVDSQVGANNELSEVLANGNTTGSNDIDVDAAQKVQFRDASIYINSSVDGQLDIVADTEIQIAATTVDINGAVDMASTLTVAGEITANGGIALGDNDKATFGDGDDLQIYHDGSNSYIQDQGLSGTGNLILAGADVEIATFGGNKYFLGSSNVARLYHTNNEKLATTSTGIDVTGNAAFADNGKATFGAGDDLQIYHSGSHSYIDEVGTGNLYVRSTKYRLANADGSKIYMTADDDTFVQLYDNNNAVKLATTSTGIDVTGSINSTAAISAVGSGNAASTAHIPALLGSGSYGGGIASRDGAESGWYQQSSGADWHFYHNRTVASQTPESKKVLSFNSTGAATFTGTATMDGLVVDGSLGQIALQSSGAELHFSRNGNNDLLANGGSSAALTIGANDNVRFLTGGAERMRISSAGHTTFGTTDLTPADNSVNGTSILSDGRINHNAQSQPAAVIGRTGTDGTIVDLRKNGAAVGSIGTKGGDMWIGTGDTGVYFASASDAFLPYNTTTNALRTDGQISLGDSSRKYKDLYLSGSVVAGTGATAAATLNAYSKTVSTNLPSALRVIENTGASSYWDIGSTGGASNNLNFYANANTTPKMTLNGAGNLGIGTSSPQAKLQVLDLIKVSSADQSSGSIIFGDGSSANYNVGIGRWNGASNAAGSGGLGYHAQGPINGGGHYWYLGDAAAGSKTEVMRINSSGRVGIGTDSPFGRLSVNVSAGAPATSGNMTNGLTVHNTDGGRAIQLGVNESGGYTYLQSAYVNNANVAQPMAFFTGGAERMRIDATGNLLVGTTSTIPFLLTSGSGAGITSSGTIMGAAAAEAGLFNRVGSDGSILSFFKSGTSVGSIGSALGDSSVSTLFIADAGNVGIRFDQASTDDIQPCTSTGADRDGAINLGASDNRFKELYLSGGVVTTSGASNTSFSASYVAGDQTATSLKLISARTDVFYHAQFFNGTTTECFRVEANGNTKNTNNSYGALSDAKLKENIVDASPKLSDLMQVKVRNYNLIGETTKQIGVVAQELETVFPSLVDENADRDADGNLLETTTKGVKYSVFVPMLIKAIQEQQTLIESLTARIAALEE